MDRKAEAISQLNRLPLFRAAALSTTSEAALNIDFLQDQFKRALFVAGQQLGVFTR